MLRLALMRHAKSDWDDAALADHERPLAPRGLRDAPRMALWLAQQGFSPDRILCSTALRARQTCEILRENLPSPSRPLLLEGLYEFARMAPLRAAIANHGGDAQALLVIGHNAAIHELALHLAARGPREDMADLSRKFPTAAVALLAFDATGWPQALARRGRLLRFMRPKRLGGS